MYIYICLYIYVYVYIYIWHYILTCDKLEQWKVKSWILYQLHFYSIHRWLRSTISLMMASSWNKFVYIPNNKGKKKLSMSFWVKSSSVITNLVHDASRVSQVRSCLERVTAGWSMTTEAWSNSTTRWETTRRCLSTTTYCPTGTGWGTGSLLWQMPWRTSTLHPSRPRKWCKLSYWLRVWAPPVPV